AERFHQIAWPLLSETGFDLINDPATTFSPFGASHAMYRSRRGLYLLGRFEPGDSNSAGISIGRLWSPKDGGRWYRLSGEYYELAKHFGFDLPKWYVLGYGESMLRTLD